MKASQINPIGNRILVLVDGPHGKQQDKGGILLPDILQYPQLQCEVLYVSLTCKASFEALHRPLLIGNKAGVSLGIDEDTGKEMRLITPADILLVL
jgi:co-chaperonin GroES (HSP10)